MAGNDDELRDLEFDLGRVSDEAAGKIKATTQRAALNIKRRLQQEASGSDHFSRVPASISYETRQEDNGIVAEIGPELGNPSGHARAQGGLAWIAYEGTARHGPVFPDPSAVAEAEGAVWEAYIAEAIMGDFR